VIKVGLFQGMRRAEGAFLYRRGKKDLLLHTKQVGDPWNYFPLYDGLKPL